MTGIASRLFTAVGFAILFAGSAVADEPKSVDLSDLRDAVKAASKRGANVDEVVAALESVEKRLAKPVAAGETPAELAALREAVEAAARKGEDVEAVRKELDAVEKAAVGKVLTAPKAELPPLREAKPSPENPRFGRRGGVIVRGGGGVVVIGGRGGLGAFQSVTIANGNFVIKAGVGGVVYQLSGELAADDADAVKVVITDGDNKVEAESLKKVPEAYRADVEKLLKSIRR